MSKAGQKKRKDFLMIQNSKNERLRKKVDKTGDEVIRKEKIKQIKEISKLCNSPDKRIKENIQEREKLMS